MEATTEASAPATDERTFFGMDVYRAGVRPRSILHPQTVDELRQMVAQAAEQGLAIITRGGGVSYTDGYLAVREDCVLIDTGALDRVVAIEPEDMLVTVEPGITWQALDAALAPFGLKVPFVGTFSGMAASVGGTISQHANGLGSNSGGISPESVVAIELLDAAAHIVHVGTAGAENARTLFRCFGPDLVGVFTGDCGALGIKTKVTLRLVRRKPAFETASFAFPDFATLHTVMARLAGERLDEKSVALDLALSKGQIAKQDTGSLLSIAASVWKSSPSFVAGVASLLRMAAAGRRVLGNAPYAAHYIVDGHDMTEARAKIATLRRIVGAAGREIPNSVPTVIKSIPFQPLHNMLGPSGERWVPLHGLFPHSRVKGFDAEFKRYVDRRRPEMDQLGAHIGAMFSCIGTTSFLYEPALYWKDALTEFHERMMDPAYLAGLPRYPANPEGAALVESIRTDLIALMHQHGAAHFQVGKLYPYLDGRDAGAVSLLRAIKAQMDPKGLLNPGVLGLS